MSMKKVLDGKPSLKPSKAPDTDKSQEATVRPTLSISIMRSGAEPVALILIQLVMTGNNSVVNLCGLLLVMVQSFGASTMVMMSGTSC